MNVEQRLAALERTARRWKLATLAVAAVAALAVYIAIVGPPALPSLTSKAHAQQAQPQKEPPIQDKLRVRSLEIVNNKGATMGRWWVSKGSPEIRMWATETSYLSIESNGPRIYLTNAHGKHALSPSGLAVVSTDRVKYRAYTRVIDKLKSGIPLADLTDEERNMYRQSDQGYQYEQAAIYADGKGGSVTIYNTHGKNAASLTCNEKNEGWLFTCDAFGQPVKGFPPSSK